MDRCLGICGTSNVIIIIIIIIMWTREATQLKLYKIMTVLSTLFESNLLRKCKKN